jgi:CRISPR-associated protein Csh2
MKNKEFLFIYEAANCNPNGDPDQENKPRMDWLTKTNLVSDARLKRYIRDYLIDEGKRIFVSQVGGQKVSVPTRLNGFIGELEASETKFNELLEFEKKIAPDDNLEKVFADLRKEIKNSEEEKEKKKNNGSNDKTEKKELTNYELFKKRTGAGYEKINNRILLALTRKEFLDIRYFGGAFAVGDFSLTITGPIQINMGYSLHPVEMNTSDGLVTIMGSKEGQSDMGKKPTLFYSLIAFTGTVNGKRAQYVNLTETGKEEDDISLFRKAIINGVNNYKSDSKKNQYPKLYLEIEYNDEATYGALGDLRNLVDVSPNIKNEKSEPDFTKVRKLKELTIKFNRLFEHIIKLNSKISKVRVWKSLDFDFFDEKQLTVEGEDKNSKVENLSF